MTARERRFECRFCGTKFVHEDRFLAHKCKQKARDEEFRTPIGQAAWSYYQGWMKVHHRQIPRSPAFLKSRFYRSFIKFAEFVKKIRLPDPETFIWLMKERDIAPTMWTMDEMYSQYLEFLDRRGDPSKQAQVTINTLFDIADAAQCEIWEVFDILTANEVIQLFRQRRLSPWLLLHSKEKFLPFFANKLSNEERIILETIIRPAFWAEKFRKNPKAVEAMKRYVSELKL